MLSNSVRKFNRQRFPCCINCAKKVLPDGEYQNFLLKKKFFIPLIFYQ
jgi:hypothetical protein